MKPQHFRQLFFQGASLIGTIVLFNLVLTSKSLAQKIVNHRDSVVKHLVGTMTASIQQAESASIQVRMTTCLVDISSDRNSVFLYQEQGFTDSLDQPYRQRFLEITTVTDQEKKEPQNLIFSHSYKPSDLGHWTNFCQSDRQQKQIKQADLGRVICTIKLKPLMSIYIGQTPLEGCATTARGATFITNSVILHQQGMETWDRGFDNEGKQLWGARQQPYQFFWDKDE